MQILKYSIVMRLFRLLYIYYNNSLVKRIIARFVRIYRHSIPGRMIESMASRQSATKGSVFIKIFRTLFILIDRFVMKISRLISDASGTSVIAAVFRAFKDTVSGGKAIALALPLFGAGYVIGRVVQNRFMLRDILFLGVTFIAGAVFLTDPEKRKKAMENSAIVKICKLVME